MYSAVSLSFALRGGNSYCRLEAPVSHEHLAQVLPFLSPSPPLPIPWLAFPTSPQGGRIGPLRFLARWRKRRLNQTFSFVLGIVRLCVCASFVSYYVCVHVYVGCILLYFVFFCVGLIDFAINFCCL